MSATTRSTRSPASASGTISITRTEQRDADTADDDRHIGDIEDRPPTADLEEVDDRSAHKGVALAENTIEHIAERTPQHETEAKDHEARFDSLHYEKHCDADTDGQNAKYRPKALAERKRRPAVEDQSKTGSPRPLYGVILERTERPRFGQLVNENNDQSDRGELPAASRHLGPRKYDLRRGLQLSDVRVHRL